MALPFPRPASLAAPYAVARCTPADAPAMVAVYLAAFAQTDFDFWWPPSGSALPEWNETRFRLRFRDPTNQQFKIEEVAEAGTGARRLVAFARWVVPPRLRDALAAGFRVYDGDDDGAAKTALSSGGGSGGEMDEAVVKDDEAKRLEAKQHNETPPEGADEAAFHHFFSALKKMGEKWDSKNMLALSLLCTHPADQGRGTAKALLDSVLAIADAEGVPTYVEALRNATGFYERYGFRKVDELDFDLTRSGREGRAFMDIMIREPQAKHA